MLKPIPNTNKDILSVQAADMTLTVMLLKTGKEKIDRAIEKVHSATNKTIETVAQRDDLSDMGKMELLKTNLKNSVALPAQELQSEIVSYKRNVKARVDSLLTAPEGAVNEPHIRPTIDQMTKMDKQSLTDFLLSDHTTVEMLDAYLAVPLQLLNVQPEIHKQIEQKYAYLNGLRISKNTGPPKKPTYHNPCPIEMDYTEIKKAFDTQWNEINGNKITEIAETYLQQVIHLVAVILKTDYETAFDLLMAK